MTNAVGALLVSLCALAGACHAHVTEKTPAGAAAEHVSIRPRVPTLREGSPLVLATIGTRRVSLVADEDEDAIHTIDMDSGLEIARTDVAGRPTQLLVTSDGRLAVAERDRATVRLFAAVAADAPLISVAAFETADEPIGLARSVDGESLFVVTGWGRTLEAFSLVNGARELSIPLGREPRAVAVSTDGGTAYVGYAAESAIGVVDLGAGAASLASLTVEAELIDSCIGKAKATCRSDTTLERIAGQTYALARADADEHRSERVFAPHVLVTPGEASVPSTAYYGPPPNRRQRTVFDLAALDTETGAIAAAEPMRRFDGCSLPRGAIYDARDDRIYVACLGGDRVVAYDADATFASELDVHVPVEGGPIAVAIDPERHELAVLAAFARNVTLFSLGEGIGFPATRRTKTIALSHVADRGLSASATAGRRLFHAANDARISSDGRACATCHPDGRDDGIVWSTPNGPRQTIFLAGRLDRGAPYGWDATHESLRAHLTVTMENLQGDGLPENELADLEEWLRTMPPPPRRPHPLDAVESRGRELFVSKKTRCSTCHDPAHDFSDLRAHDVASKTKADSTARFLAPSLRFIGGSAPYFHDGRHLSLAGLLRACDDMGSTDGLDENALGALEAYLRTL